MPFAPEDIKQRQREWKMKYDVRRRAQQAMDDLTFIFECLPRVSRCPERDYAMIFQDEQRYFRMVEVCARAYEQSYRSKLKLFAPENLRVIQTVCVEAGLKVPSLQQLADRHVRDRVVIQLQRKKTGDGQSYYERARARVLFNRDQERSRQSCRLVSALLQVGYEPADLGLSVGDLFHEAMGGEVCVGWRQCKRIRDAVLAAVSKQRQSLESR